MGGHILGNLGVHVRNIITYSLSPYEQRALGGFLSRDMVLFAKRSFTNAQNMFPGLGGAAGIYYFTVKKAKEIELAHQDD